MLRRAAAPLLVALILAGCGGSDPPPESTPGGSDAASAKAIKRNPANASTMLTIASKNFTEEFILGEIYSQALEAGGYKIRKRLDLGSEKVAFRAVKSGKVDAYPEYTGTAFFGVQTDDIPKDEQEAYDQAKASFAEERVTALPPTPFTDSNAVGMTQTRAQELGIETISDLKGKAGR